MGAWRQNIINYIKKKTPTRTATKQDTAWNRVGLCRRNARKKLYHKS